MKTEKKKELSWKLFLGVLLVATGMTIGLGTTYPLWSFVMDEFDKLLFSLLSSLETLLFIGLVSVFWVIVIIIVLLLLILEKMNGKH